MRILLAALESTLILMLIIAFHAFAVTFIGSML